MSGNSVKSQSLQSVHESSTPLRQNIKTVWHRSPVVVAVAISPITLSPSNAIRCCDDDDATDDGVAVKSGRQIFKLMETIHNWEEFPFIQFVVYSIHIYRPGFRPLVQHSHRSVPTAAMLPVGVGWDTAFACQQTTRYFHTRTHIHLDWMLPRVALAMVRN